MTGITPENIRVILDHRESGILSSIATQSKHGLRRRYEKRLDMDYRQAFSIDADRILHSRSYTRYIDKTQVFYLVENDHITHRVLHVQLVSKISRTIGRFLGLNEDLIEAIALGHDIGHCPFGHDGEKYLSRLCHESGIGYFLHNVQSIQFLDCVEKQGSGCNLCVQTLDGILCHDGEIHNQAIKPQEKKTFASLEKEIGLKKNNPDIRLMPMTLEGCVVRMADTISYIGRDIEDAIIMNVLKRSEIPEKCAGILGETNGNIIYNLVTDIIKNSFEHEYVRFSDQVSEALKQLKAFNSERIYLNPNIKKHSLKIKNLFEILFWQYVDDIEKQNHNSVIFTSFISDKSEDYIQKHSTCEIVRDFIAGMTDQYFLRQCPENMQPKA
jgi:dGTPase